MKNSFKWFIWLFLAVLFSFSSIVIVYAHENEPDADQFSDSPSVLEGLCFDPVDGVTLRYYKNGAVDTSFTGFALLNDEARERERWFYVEGGTVSGNRNDIVNGTIGGVSGWYLIRGSEFTPDTTVAKNVNGWWYVKDGKVDFSYKGFESNEYGRWYLEGGKVSFQFTGFAKDTDGWRYVSGSKTDTEKTDVIYGTAAAGTLEKPFAAWWCVKGGKVYAGNTVAKNQNGWWKITGGKVDFGFNGFEKNEYGWWYLENGKVTFQKDDILSGTANTDPEAVGENGWWLVRGSKVTKTETVAKNRNGWWHVKDGKVDFTSNTVAKNENGWWKITNGKVDFYFNGFEKNIYGWWYLENGKVTFQKNDILSGTANTDPEAKGEYGWWYISSSKVTKTETVAKNINGWWYVREGKVDFGYTGIRPNSYGWWRIVNGKVDFNCNSVEENENGWWYLKGGKVDFGYYGLARNSNGWWYISGGKVDFSYTGAAVNNGIGYHIINGGLDWSYSGTFSGGDSYTVKNGQIMSGWASYLGNKYYFTGSGTLATETVFVNGVPEVFRMDGRWINTGDMDQKAAGYSSRTNYLILVSISDRVTKIYRRSGSAWVTAQNYLCTVGDPRYGWDTVKGDFYVGYSSWGNPITRGYSFEDTDGHTLYYWTRFCDSFLFHSQMYDLYSYNLTKNGNALGEALSHGCVRLRFDNARWIYENIPDGTRVIVY